MGFSHVSLFSVSIARCIHGVGHGMDGWSDGWMDGLQFASIRFRHDAILDSVS